MSRLDVKWFLTMYKLYDSKPERPVMSILGRFLAFKTTTVILLAAGWIENLAFSINFNSMICELFFLPEGWTFKMISILRIVNRFDFNLPTQPITWWQRETRSSPLPWLLSLSLLGVISLARERGQVSDPERSIPSSSTITSPTTSSRL